MELRFVKRYVPAPEYGKNTSKETKVLQWRDMNGGVRQWIDVPLVDEDETPTG